MISALSFLVVVVGTSAAGPGRPKGVTCSADWGVYNTSFTLITAWDGLSTSQRTNAGKCGMDRTSWDGPSDCISCWSNLSKAKQQANLILGSNAACFDASMNLYDLNCATKLAPSDCDVDSSMLKTKRAAVMKPWSQLSAALKTAATTCGYSKRTWDGPSECRACFSDLSPARKQAVLSFGTDAECWDLWLLAQFRVDCVGLMHDTPDSSKRAALYAGLSQASVQKKFQIRHKVTTPTSTVFNFSQVTQVQLLSLSLVGLVLVFLTISSGKVSLGNASMRPESIASFNDDIDDELQTLLRVEDQPLE